MTRQTVRLGFLYPGFAAEDDYPRLAERLGVPVEVELVHTSVGEDAHRIDALLDLGSTARLLEGAEALRGRAVDAVMWACTSGSFVFGWEGARRQAAALEDTLGVPVSSTSFAFPAAAEALGVRTPRRTPSSFRTRRCTARTGWRSSRTRSGSRF